MTDLEFIESTVGKPWVNRSTGPDSFDCFGLVIAYYKDVKGITLPEIKGYSDGSTSIMDGFFEQSKSGLWNKDKSGVLFMAFAGDIPAHCGLIINGSCLHALGDEAKGGQVYYHKLRTLQKIYTRLEFWEYVG